MIQKENKCILKSYRILLEEKWRKLKLLEIKENSIFMLIDWKG